jgi:hypothetical protein
VAACVTWPGRWCPLLQGVHWSKCVRFVRETPAPICVSCNSLHQPPTA